MDEKGTLDLKATIDKHQELLMGNEEEEGEMQKVLRMHMEPPSSASQHNLNITTATIQCGDKCSCLEIIRLPISPPDYLYLPVFPHFRRNVHLTFRAVGSALLTNCPHRPGKLTAPQKNPFGRFKRVHHAKAPIHSIFVLLCDRPIKMGHP